MRFILVDEIIEMQPGRHVRAVKTMHPEEELFRDHFPGFPVIPGVLLVEMMGQAAGKCLVAEDSRRGLPMLAKVMSASFRDWINPGQVSTILADILSSRPQFATASCRIEVEQRTMAEASLFFVFLPHDRLAVDYRDMVLERFLNRQCACDQDAGTPKA